MSKLLEMASKPVEEALHGVKNYHDSKIALNSCQILSKLVAELSADAMGINVSILVSCATSIFWRFVSKKVVDYFMVWNIFIYCNLDL